VEACLALGLVPDIIVGDMDSVSTDVLVRAEALGAKVVRFPAHKDETDLELALLEAARLEARVVDIHGAVGGRIDHTMANMDLGFRFTRLGLDIRVCGDWGEALFLSGQVRCVELVGNPGDTVSLMPWTERASGVCTWGLEYPLNEEDLRRGYTRGVSNRMIGEAAGVSVRVGDLLVIHLA
jgi:thiamine pyrophosphokinase